MANEPTFFDRVGEAKLAAIIHDFVGRMFVDPMIGFMFAKASQERIERHEREHAARFLGAEVEYTGRALDAAHRRHRIMGGQFARRKELLRQVLVAHAVDDDIREAWLAHTESLRGQVTGDPGSECR